MVTKSKSTSKELQMSLIRAISMTNAIKYYYEKDPICEEANFYNTKWHGKASENLGLKNEIKKEDFESILKGENPNDKKK